MDEDVQAAAARLVRRIKEGGHTITVAESCTGGLLSSAFTDIAGASSWFNQAWVTYSNDAKIRELGVKPSSLEKKGAVSAEVAIQMAQGALKNSTTRPVCERPTTYEKSTRIAQFISGPWLHSEEIEAIVQTGVQAIVIQGTGLGHLPIEDPGKDA
ncbi:nicotinamide-nucleotide amidohydrolase family protein, partial [Euryarchaeota archaeon]|nr:nicotinamide-nucleotide amidohydrolase family protein [Euryarchaeota archaeon]